MNDLFEEMTSLKEDLFEAMAEAVRPVITITAFVGTKKKQHTFLAGTPTREIQSFLINTYGENCWSWDKN